MTTHQSERDRIKNARAGNQQRNHMHHIERSEDESQNRYTVQCALIVQIKPDPHTSIK